MTEESERQVRVINANHLVFRRQQDHIKLLSILLRLAKGQWVGIQDRWEARGIIEQYPEFAHYAEGVLTIRKNVV